MPTLRINQSMTLVEWGSLLALSVLWGGSFFFIGVAVQELPPITIVTIRLILAALALYVVARMTDVRLPTDWQTWRAFTWLGLLNNVIPFCLFAWSQTHISGGLASILNATTPLFTVVVAHLLTRDEKMSGARIIGAVIGLAGVAAMIGSEALSFFSTNVLAQIACLVASLCYAFAGVFGRRFSAMNIQPLASATAQLTASAVILLPVMLIVDRPWSLPIPSASTVAALIAQALFSTAFAFVLFFRILATAGATNVALVTFLNPATAILLGVAFLNERIAPAHILGMAVIGAGLAFIDGRPVKAALHVLRIQPRPEQR
jgi:drug/metabolite transporter (DMT)-like permease